MKRFISILLIFCLVFCLLPMSVFAANSTYELDELGMSIEVPSGHVVFTRDIKSNDPNLSAYGLTKDGLYSLMLEQNIYLNTWDEDINYEIIVTMIDSPLEDFNQLSDTSLAVLTPTMSKEYESAGITYIKSDIYQHNQAKFIKIYISQPNNGDTVYGLQYYTVYNGKAINVTLQSYSGKIDSNKEAIIQEIVDTVRFETEPHLSSPPVQTKAFTYTDPNSGMTFTVPVNWAETPMNEERKFIDVKFTSNLEEGLCILFSSEDLYELEEFKLELSTTEQLLLTRDLIGNDIFTKADIAEIYGCKEKDVSMVTYGGKEYYSAEIVNSGTAYGLTLSTPMVYLIRCENGYMYVFQFNGSSSSKYFQDFKKLVSSAKYPEFKSDETVRDQVFGAYLLLAIIALIALCLVLIFICRSMIKKKSIEKKRKTDNSMIEDFTAVTVIEHASDAFQIKVEKSITPEPPVKADKEEPRTILVEQPGIKDDGSASFCHRCGNKLMSGSLFCNKCGTKIPANKEL